MNEKDYNSLLEELVNKKVKFLKIEPEEFMKFQPILMNFRQRKRIIGRAQPKGTVIYYYEDNNK